MCILILDIELGNKFGEVEYGFNVTHPFLFFVDHQSTGEVLFVGKVVNPLESEPIPIPTRFGEDSAPANGSGGRFQLNYRNTGFSMRTR